MTDDPIRELLASLQESSMIRRPPGTIAILRERVQSAGGDVDAADTWVAEHGGAVRRTAPIRSSGLRPGRVTQRTMPGVLYYLLPRDVLRPS
jgi:hypothetical protein